MNIAAIKIEYNCQTKCCPLLNPSRGFHSSLLLYAQKDQKENQLESSDKIRVYYGTLTPQIRAVKVFSLTTSIVGVCAQPVLYEQAVRLGSSTPVIVAVCGFIGFFTFITPFLIHMITKKYVTELHYDKKNSEYIASVITFYLTKKQIKFKPEDVSVPDIPGMFASFNVKDKDSKKSHPLFVDPRLFEDTQHYIKIMGFDKPIDFQMDYAEKENTENKK
ncbi:hypothetical protein ACKWTF_004445 [Chironomus riparius]